MPPPASQMREAFDVMIAAVALRHRRAAEFAAPDDQRVVEQAALFQILDQRRRSPDRLRSRDHGNVALDVAVMIPVAVIELDEAHAALGQPPRQQAVGGERAVAALGAVQVERRLASRSVRSISSGTLVCMRNAISYWLMRVAISGSSTMLVEQSIERFGRVDDVALLLVRHAGGAADVQHRIALGAELDALELARQKAAVPLPRGDRLHLAGPPVEVSTTKPGRLSASLPRPYQSHEPMLGRPEMVVPVFMKVWAGS